MKNLFLMLACFLFLYQVQGQRTVSFRGHIKNINPEESIYLGLDQVLLPLKIREDGTFEVEEHIEQNPSFFFFAIIAKGGKIEHKTPLIWFKADRIKVTLDWSNKSFETMELMPFQSLSEKIEALSEDKQLELIQKNPNEIPSLYFLDAHKEKHKVEVLDTYFDSLNEENKMSVYAKRVANYLAAIKRPALKKGETVENFQLPNKKNELVDVIYGKNKPQLIGLLSSGCAYSIVSLNLLKQLSELNDDSIEIVTIWDDKSKNTWLNSHQDEKSNITWTNLWDEFGFAKTYLNRKIWPTFYIINKNGELTQILMGYDKKTVKELKRLVEQS